MVSPFHIFKVQSDDSRRWIEAAANLEHAKTRVTVLAASSPGEYVIYDEATGERVSVTADENAGSESSLG